MKVSFDGTRITIARPLPQGEYVRVHVEGKVEGNWFMKASDIKGLTPKQIQEKFNLPSAPTQFSYVDPPVGTTIRIGSVNNGGRQAVQYQIVGKTSENWFTPGGDFSK